MAEAIKTLAKYMRHRFEEVNKRFEMMDRRFEEIDKRFMKIDERFVEMNRRLEEHSKILMIHANALDRLIREVGSFKAMVDGFTSRGRIQLERMILNLFRKTLMEMKGIDVERIEKRGFRDRMGEFLRPGQKIDIDIYMGDRKTYAVEVKSFVESNYVDWIIARKSFWRKDLSLNLNGLLLHQR